MTTVHTNNELCNLVPKLEFDKCFIQTIANYMDSLNEYDNAICPINKDARLANPARNGVFVESTPKTFKMFFGSEFNPIVYRGLNNDYVFMPDSQRYELFDGKERIRHSINWIKKHEFLSLMSRTPYFTIPQNFNISGHSFELDLEAISKHYHYMSDCIDVTRNILVAYFFAYTYYNSEKQQWLPIESFDINTPVLYAGSLKELYKAVPDAVKNTGLQPLLRSIAQQTMSINTSNNRELIQGLFRKIELPKNPNIARYVYDLFEGGNLLFPPDYISRCAASVKVNKTLHEDLFIRYCEETNTDINWLKEELSELGYEFVDQPWNIPEQAKEIINREFSDKIIPFIKTNFIGCTTEN